jgi:hypothetical protein
MFVWCSAWAFVRGVGLSCSFESQHSVTLHEHVVGMFPAIHRDELEIGMAWVVVFSSNSVSGTRNRDVRCNLHVVVSGSVFDKQSHQIDQSPQQQTHLIIVDALIDELVELVSNGQLNQPISPNYSWVDGIVNGLWGFFWCSCLQAPQQSVLIRSDSYR